VDRFRLDDNHAEYQVHQRLGGIVGIGNIDAAGNPVESPPILNAKMDKMGNLTYFDPWGNQVPTLYPPPGTAPAEWPPGSGKSFEPPTFFVNPKPGGGFDVVDASGNPLQSPPQIKFDPTYKSKEYFDPWGNQGTDAFIHRRDQRRQNGRRARARRSILLPFL
jgi:hypothetical protein